VKEKLLPMGVTRIGRGGDRVREKKGKPVHYFVIGLKQKEAAGK